MSEPLFRFCADKGRGDEPKLWEGVQQSLDHVPAHGHYAKVAKATAIGSIGCTIMQGSHRHGGGLTRIQGDGAAPVQTLLVSLLTR